MLFSLRIQFDFRFLVFQPEIGLWCHDKNGDKESVKIYLIYWTIWPSFDMAFCNFFIYNLLFIIQIIIRSKLSSMLNFFFLLFMEFLNIVHNCCGSFKCFHKFKTAKHTLIKLGRRGKGHKRVDIFYFNRTSCH